ncbi:MAG: hypothetical protein IVW55_02280 [Chloroflexi bacterium]|nr:hypothetical protein [Chloroflexota bacterium]
MSRLFASLGQSSLVIWAGLRVPGFYLVLFLSLGLWSIAYQHKQAYSVEAGSLTDNGYLSGFYTKEHNPPALPNYRWSTDASTVRFPGVGNEPVYILLTTVGARPNGPSPVITVTVRNTTFTVQTQPSLYTDTLFIGRGDMWNGNLEVKISSPTYVPAKVDPRSIDKRELGVTVSRITVQPADYGLRPLVIPPVATIGYLLAGLIFSYFCALVTTRKRLYSLWLVAALSLGAAALIVWARMELGLLAGELPSLLGWGLLLALCGRAAMDLLPVHVPHRAFLAASGSAALVLAFLIRFGGVTYPQFQTSDIGLHINNTLKVLEGDWLFPGELPDGTVVPYPPALYVVISPLAALLGASREMVGLILKWSASLLDALTCLALAWAGSRLWPGRAGGIAALAYAFSLAPFDLFSAGNYSNLFAQSVFNLTMLGAVVFLCCQSEGRMPLYAALLALGFSLTLLGHYGMMLAALAILALFALWIMAAAFQGSKQPAGWTLLGSFAAAFGVTFGLYYWHFLGEMWAQLSSVLNRLLGGRGTAPDKGASTARAFFGATLGRRIDSLLGTPAALCALFGLLLPGKPGSSPRALLLAWLLASGIFALLDQALGDSIRWSYLAAAAVTLVGGRFLALLASRNRLGRTLVALTITVMLLQLLYFWVGYAIFTRYHDMP